jgi:uncharacterized metal-binding protein
MKEVAARCAACGLDEKERICTNPEGRPSKGCPTVKKELVEKAREEYMKEGVREFALKASLQEAECYADRGKKPYVLHPTKPRIQEICEFAWKMGYKRLGLIFCLGLRKEAEAVNTILEAQGFEVVSIACKAGRMAKEELGIKEEEKIFIGEFESACNPILQAFVANDEGTELNILLGLCVGHDSLFFKYAKAPTTVLAVKDRVTGHNPLAPIYNVDSYYARLRRKGF